MILKLEQVVTETSLGSFILQIDKDEIISVEPHEGIKSGYHPMNAPIGYCEDGSFSNLVKYYIKIKLKNNTTREIEFSDIMYRDQAIDYIMNEMLMFVPPQNRNKLYKKEHKDATSKALEVVSMSYKPQLKLKPTRRKFPIGNKEIL